MKALDYMIDNALYAYRCDPWSRDPDGLNYSSVETTKGQVNYKGEIFIIYHRPERHGSGGMDQGSPDTAIITRIEKTSTMKTEQMQAAAIEAARKEGMKTGYLRGISESAAFVRRVRNKCLDADRKMPYLFCTTLNYSPLEILGLSEPLMRYIRPKEMQIMLDLIKDNLILFLMT